jgi:hypothetical protein
MTFWCSGRSYESGKMRQFLTDDPTTPLILVTPDYKRVFVMTLEGCMGSRIHQANTLQIISLATRYGLKDLLNAYPSPAVGDVEVELVV